MISGAASGCVWPHAHQEKALKSIEKSGFAFAGASVRSAEYKIVADAAVGSRCVRSSLARLRYWHLCFVCFGH